MEKGTAKVNRKNGGPQTGLGSEATEPVGEKEWPTEIGADRASGMHRCRSGKRRRGAIV